MVIIEGAISALLLVGVGLTVVAAIGLHRLPDVFSRMHAATKPATLGLLCVLSATALAVGEASAAAKLALVAALQFLTNPVGSHMVGRAAWRAGSPTHPATRVDGQGAPEPLASGPLASGPPASGPPARGPFGQGPFEPG